MKRVELKKEIVGLMLIMIIQTIIYVGFSFQKSYIHMDEAYSLGLASYESVELSSDASFYNTWHNGIYFEDYLTINNDEVGKYSQVYENQKNDVHPPFYYLLLRFSMGFHLNDFSVWPGIILNIVIFLFVTIFSYLITRKVTKESENSISMSFFITALASISLASITNVLYIRMYALSTLNILITTYLHLKLFEKNTKKTWVLIGVGASALIGSLTHYYYLFYLFGLAILFFMKYLKEKKYLDLGKYLLTLASAAGLSLLIFPYSIKHLFFGYRGQGALDNLMNVSEFLKSIQEYFMKINLYGFNNIFYLLVLFIIVIIIYKLCKSKKIVEHKNKYFKYLLVPTIFYFVLVSISSPWKELRYILPVTGVIFILVFLFLLELLNNIIKKNQVKYVYMMIAFLMLIAPVITNQFLKTTKQNFRLEPEVMYSNRKDIVKKIKDNKDIPAIYFFNSNHNRFLDDILLFSILNDSYIAKDLAYNNENIQNIFKEKNTSQGIYVFINYGQMNDSILNVVKKSLNLKEVNYVTHLNSCDVYYLK